MNGLYLVLEKELEKFKNEGVGVRIGLGENERIFTQYVYVSLFIKERIDLSFIIRKTKDVFFVIDLYGTKPGSKKKLVDAELKEYQEEIFMYHKIIKSNIENIIRNDRTLRLQHLLGNGSLRDGFAIKYLRRNG